MRALCHRCHGELPEPSAGSSANDEDALLFCPRCGAPQILLPEHMRNEAPAPGMAALTTGTLPPPRPAGAGVGPGQVVWRAALRAGMAVATVSAVLTLAGLAFAPVSPLTVIWTLAGALIAVKLYARWSPLAAVDSKVGKRIGTATGLLMLAFIVVALAGAGVVLRFGTHGLEQFDRDNAAQRKAVHEWSLNWFERNTDDKDMQAQYAQQLNSPFLNSPEVQAGGALASVALQGLLLVLLSTALGSVAGRLQAVQTARAGVRRRN